LPSFLRKSTCPSIFNDNRLYPVAAFNPQLIEFLKPALHNNEASRTKPAYTMPVGNFAPANKSERYEAFRFPQLVLTWQVIVPPLTARQLDSALFGRTTAVVWDRRHVGDRSDLHTGSHDRSDCAFSAGAWPLHENVDLSHVEVAGRLASHALGSQLGCKWCALPAPLEPASTTTGPTQDIALRIGNRHDGVVKCCVNMNLTDRD
jgi:hypothetical protein